MTQYAITFITDPKRRALTEAEILHATPSGLAIQAVEWLSEGEAYDVIVETENKPEIVLEGVDVIIQPALGRRKKLLISDMDSTMIEQECIDELADKVGLKPQVSTITERAMNGELDFAEALQARVALLRGLPVAELEAVYREKITLMAGAKELVATMRAHGAYCLLVSGGFTFFTGRVADALGFHDHHANVLSEAHGKLTGHVVLPILGKEAKLASLMAACEEHGLKPEDALAIGDGANDLPMLQAAGLGVAYHAKPIVRSATNAALNVVNLRGVLFAQGYKRGEWV